MVKQLMPQVTLDERDGDIRLSEEQYFKLSLFSQLKRKPSLEKFPGAMVVRCFKKGEVIFRQGEAGWTAFYLLTTEDGLAIRQMQLEAARSDYEKRVAQAEVAALQKRLAQIQGAADKDAARKIATVFLAVPRNPREKKEAGG